MSVYANNEYIVSSNNSMNENKYNTEKLKSRGLRALWRPLMRAIKKSISKPSKQHFATSYEEEQNSSNESLERQLIAEMQHCAPGAAILVYGDEDCTVVPVTSEDCYVPVNFARTSAGTFFWTSVSKAEADLASPGHCYTECQSAEQQIPHFADRWVQA